MTPSHRGIDLAVRDLTPHEVIVDEKFHPLDAPPVLRMWFDHVVFQPPERYDSPAILHPSQAASPEDRAIKRQNCERGGFSYPGQHRFQSTFSQRGVLPAAHLIPPQCRLRRLSYHSQLRGTIRYELSNGDTRSFDISLGQVPVMVKSILCPLSGLTGSELVQHHEERNEMGGYFISNGLERLFRLVIMPRRNLPMSVVMGAFTKRGPRYTPYGVRIRCGRPDSTTATVTVHYLNDGTCQVRFVRNKSEYFIPAGLLLRAFVPNTTDKEIYSRIIQGNDDDSFLAERAELLIQDANARGCHTQTECQRFIGDRFRRATAHRHVAGEVICQQIIKAHLFVHLERGEDKWELLIYMIRKLFSLVKSDGAEGDPQDSLGFQEVLLPGHLYLALIKERLDILLQRLTQQIEKTINDGTESALSSVSSHEFLEKCLAKLHLDVGKPLQYLVATGNVQSISGLDLLQQAGLSVVAEKLNWLRYISHFAAVHRGQFFTTMKTTAIRKLLPDSWGFLCPVHTPDGSPCGLLNHLSAPCEVVCESLPDDNIRHIRNVLIGMDVAGPSVLTKHQPDDVAVLLNGTVVGWIRPDKAGALCSNLRAMKVAHSPGIPYHMEIVPNLHGTSPTFPSISIFTTSARMIRPVVSMHYGDGNQVEWIGTMEQLWLNVACLPEDVHSTTTHREISPHNILSVVAQLTPYSDFNQSPRNMYQCQMGKQSMATPLHSYPFRTDSKLYRLNTPQTPIARTQCYDEYDMNEFPIGINAVVAVISYTGYDMEDAMIIKKSSYERGFMHGSVYKNENHSVVSRDDRSKFEPHRFDNSPSEGKKPEPSLDEDGLPQIGQKMVTGSPLVCVLNKTRGIYTTQKHKALEEAYVDRVAVHGKDFIEAVDICLRFPRNPIIGDKFSSRHGQKGVMSVLWPEVDMPFSESGISPDVIINPHAFPSRMTIGMLIESMAGKAGAMHGIFQDATPFIFDEKNRALDYFGRQLRAAGYNYAGNEPMYSGITGTEMRADIFVGVVYYQRLRHMVSDKFQVRSEGPVNAIHRQPVKGRKVGGGIRFGEMERDALIAHGCSFLLQDRLMHCSDGHRCYACSQCGSVITPFLSEGEIGSAVCTACKTEEGIEVVQIPFVLRYLSVELAAMNIRLGLDLQRPG